MNIGVNLTSPKSVSIASKLLEMQAINFYELLLDNFIFCDPYVIRDKFGSIPVSFHIMYSKFMERNPKDLKTLSVRIKHWIDVLKPIYVSDHIAKFSVDGRSLTFLGEVNYKKELLKVKNSVQEWQELLGEKIYFENFPSFVDYDAEQIDFLAKLKNETGCGVLFDFSNAVIASKNSQYSLNQWLSMASDSKHFHIAGYCESDTEPKLWMDSHDCAISPKTLDFFGEFLKYSESCIDRSIIIERDSEIELKSLLLDIAEVRGKIHQMDRLYV